MGNFKNRLKELRLKNKKTQTQMSLLLNISQAAYSKYENGKAEPDSDSLKTLAQFFNVSIDYLIGQENLTALEKYPTIQVGRLPIIGKITAGYNGLATEDYTNEYQEIPLSIINGYSMEDLFVLEVSGASMYPQFLEGDRVLVHRQSSVDSGDVAVVLYDSEEATIKQVRYVLGEDWFELIPRNPEYPIKRIEGADLEQCRVLGKVIYLFRKI